MKKFPVEFLQKYYQASIGHLDYCTHSEKAFIQDFLVHQESNSPTLPIISECDENPSTIAIKDLDKPIAARNNGGKVYEVRACFKHQAIAYYRDVEKKLNEK